MLSLIERIEWYLDTLNECGLHLLMLSDEDIGYYIFEEFDADCISCLSECSLNILLNNGIINKKIYQMSLELAAKFRQLENTELWNVDSIKTNKQWRDVLLLSDEIKCLYFTIKDV